MEQTANKSLEHWVFVGMSRAGKSFSSSRLQALGFEKVECDTLIREKMTAKTNLAFPEGQDLGDWLGLPTSPAFAERQRLCIEAERETMQDILRELDQKPARFIIDTGGSVVYTGEDVLQALKARCKVIYFEVAEEAFPKMLEEYLACPLPLIWGDAFADNFETSYPRLIAERAEIYRALADVTLPYEFHRNPHLTTETLYEYISRACYGNCTN